MMRILTPQKGFTIVELLIVIVVIGILAAITIVAFNGVTNKATVASVQSDIESTVKSLETYKFTKSSSELYPADATTGGLKASGSNSLTYTALNGQKGYCAQYSNGATSYYAVAGGSVKSGACTTITNILLNPDFELNSTNWTISGTGTTAAISTEQAHSGKYSLKVNPASSAYSGVGYSTATGAPNGSTYTFSAWVYSTATQSINFAADAMGVNSAPTVGPSWQRLTINGTKTGDGWLNIRVVGTSGIPYYIDDVMFTQGSTTYDYADGNNQNWTWTGTPHASTSTGPIL